MTQATSEYLLGMIKGQHYICFNNKTGENSENTGRQSKIGKDYIDDRYKEKDIDYRYMT